MISNRVAALTLAISLGAASASVNAASMPPIEMRLGAITQLSTEITQVVSRFEENYSVRRDTHPSVDIFAGPYRLMVARSDERDLSAMIMASLGLIAMIAYRRRTI